LRGGVCHGSRPGSVYVGWGAQQRLGSGSAPEWHLGQEQGRGEQREIAVFGSKAGKNLAF